MSNGGRALAAAREPQISGAGRARSSRPAAAAASRQASSGRVVAGVNLCAQLGAPRAMTRAIVQANWIGAGGSLFVRSKMALREFGLSARRAGRVASDIIEARAGKGRREFIHAFCWAGAFVIKIGRPCVGRGTAGRVAHGFFKGSRPA